MTQKRIAVLETLSWQLPVLDIVNTPTVSTAGTRYVVGTSPTGDFSGQAKKIAWRDASQWHFDTPEEGWRVYVKEEGKDYWYDGSVWQAGLIEGDFIHSISSATDGYVPQWDGTSGNQVKNGLQVRTTIREDGTADDESLGTEKAIRDAVNAIIGAVDAMVYKGAIDASGNPNYPAADAGHTYKISVAGKIGGASGEDVEVGDMIICINNETASGTQAAVGASWNIIQVNIEGYVLGPASAADNNLASFDGVTGKLIQDSGIAQQDVIDHLNDTNNHFTEASIDHTNIQNAGDYTHANIDTHIRETSIHRPMTYSATLKSIIYTETNDTFPEDPA